MGGKKVGEYKFEPDELGNYKMEQHIDDETYEDSLKEQLDMDSKKVLQKLGMDDLKKPGYVFDEQTMDDLRREGESTNQMMMRIKENRKRDVQRMKIIANAL